MDVQHIIFQGTHWAFVCTFVLSGRFLVLSEILIKAVLGEAQLVCLFSNREW